MDVQPALVLRLRSGWSASGRRFTHIAKTLISILANNRLQALAHSGAPVRSPPFCARAPPCGDLGGRIRVELADHEPAFAVLKMPTCPAERQGQPDPLPREHKPCLKIAATALLGLIGSDDGGRRAEGGRRYETLYPHRLAWGAPPCRRVVRHWSHMQAAWLPRATRNCRSISGRWTAMPEPFGTSSDALIWSCGCCLCVTAAVLASWAIATFSSTRETEPGGRTQGICPWTWISVTTLMTTGHCGVAFGHGGKARAQPFNHIGMVRWIIAGGRRVYSSSWAITCPRTRSGAF